MRLWSIHPVYLDSKGLVALWREGLLAQKVLSGDTKGYKNHPQLIRFKNCHNPIGAIASYLRVVQHEAHRRGYQFDQSKIINKYSRKQLTVTDGQLDYEFLHLLNKLKTRDQTLYLALKNQKEIKPHPLFTQVEGLTENWEIFKP